MTRGAMGDILIIEDEPLISQMVVVLLGANNYRVRSASSGEEGLMAIMDRQPALILLDLVLPGLSSEPLVQQIRAAAPQVPIVIVSASLDLARPLSEQYGTGRLDKPFTVEELLDCVQAYMPPSP